jgi:hypothetical protein
VDIVHEKDIDTPVFLTEIQDFSVLKMVDEVIHEFFGCDIENFQAGIIMERKMADGIHQVGLSEPGAAVDIKRIVGFCRVLGHGRSGGMGKLVA